MLVTLTLLASLYATFPGELWPNLFTMLESLRGQSYQTYQKYESINAIIHILHHHLHLSFLASSTWCKSFESQLCTIPTQ